MGLTFYKGINVGPFRFNLSGSGLGLSTGVKGFRIGTGPRGTYVSIGAGGFRYRTHLNSSGGRGVSPSGSQSRINQISRSENRPESLHSVQMTEIASADVALLTDEGSAGLLNELNEREAKISLVSITNCVAFLAAGGLAVSWCNFPHAVAPKVGLLLLLICYVAAVIYAYFADLTRLQTVLMFDGSDAYQAYFQSILNAFQSAASCSKISHVRAQGLVDLEDRKYHAGATKELDLRDIDILFEPPPRIKTNVNPVHLCVGKEDLYFFPDRLLVKSDSRFGSVAYESLKVQASTAKLIVATAPNDGRVVGRTWQYVNKNGGPDKRFKDNSELPIVEFSTLLLQSAQGLNELFYFSRPNASDSLKKSLEEIKDEIRTISAQKAVAPIAEAATTNNQGAPAFNECRPVAEAASGVQKSTFESAKPEAAAEPSVQYYLGLNGENLGLFYETRIRELIESQQLQAGTMYWDSVSQQWLDINQFPK